MFAIDLVELINKSSNVKSDLPRFLFKTFFVFVKIRRLLAPLLHCNAILKAPIFTVSSVCTYQLIRTFKRFR